MIRRCHIPGSRSTWVSRLPEELGLHRDLRKWLQTGGSLLRADLLAVSSAGRVPVQEIDDGPIFVSGAIVQYLTERERRLAPLPDPADRVSFPGRISFALALDFYEVPYAWQG